MLTLVGAFAGVRIFGMMGVFIGPLLLSYFFELVRIDEEMAGQLATNEVVRIEPAPVETGTPS